MPRQGWNGVSRSRACALATLLLAFSLAAPVVLARSAPGAATDVRALALDSTLFPPGAQVDSTHVYRTPVGVDTDLILDIPETHGALYGRLGFLGSVGEDASITPHDGSRLVSLLATLFPSVAAARQAYAADVTEALRLCPRRLAVPVPGLVRACLDDSAGDFVQAHLVGTIGKAEYIVTSYDKDASDMANRAQADAVLVARHEAQRIVDLANAGRLTTIHPVPTAPLAPGLPAPCRSRHALLVDGTNVDQPHPLTLHGNHALAVLCIINGGVLAATGDLSLRIGYLYIEKGRAPHASAIDANGADGNGCNGDDATSDGSPGRALTILVHQAVIAGDISSDGGAGQDGHCNIGNGGAGGHITLEAQNLALTGSISAVNGDGGAGYYLNTKQSQTSYPGKGGTITLLLPHTPPAALRPHLYAGLVHLRAIDPADLAWPSGASPGTYVAATEHNLTGPFYTFYHRAPDAEALLGNPRTEPFEDSGRLVQYFDHVALQARGGRVALLPLGRLLTRGRVFPRRAPMRSTSRSVYFPATGHDLAGRFLAYWRAHAGAVYLGAPLSDVVIEGNGDGSGRRYPIQWCEYGRLEYHAEHRGTRFAIQLGLLGVQALKAHGL